jgi:Domain of unknown function (DUF1911)
MNNDKHFLELRRQPFLTEEYSIVAIQRIANRLPMYLDEIASEPDVIAHKGLYEAIADELTNRVHLRYTAGEPIVKLAGDMDEVVEAWEDYAKAEGVIGATPQGSIFRFSYRIDFTKGLGLVGLAILLRREDLLVRIDSLMAGYKGGDAIYEELLAPFIPDRPYTESWYHDVPYGDALDAIDSEDPKDQSELMAQAVESWYAASEGEPYHDTHKDIDDEGNGAYYGYWCFELAALCFIHNIDDSSFRDAITYPKDLVDYARSKGRVGKAAQPAAAVLSAKPSSICTKAGLWFAPNDGKREIRMNVGEKFPAALRGSTGEMIWYWKSE